MTISGDVAVLGGTIIARDRFENTVVDSSLCFLWEKAVGLSSDQKPS
jgi:hypothetical protein